MVQHPYHGAPNSAAAGDASNLGCLVAGALAEPRAPVNVFSSLILSDSLRPLLFRIEIPNTYPMRSRIGTRFLGIPQLMLYGDNSLHFMNFYNTNASKLL